MYPLFYVNQPVALFTVWYYSVPDTVDCVSFQELFFIKLSLVITSMLFRCAFVMFSLCSLQTDSSRFLPFFKCVPVFHAINLCEFSSSHFSSSIFTLKTWNDKVSEWKDIYCRLVWVNFYYVFHLRFGSSSNFFFFYEFKGLYFYNVFSFFPFIGGKEKG